MPGPSDPGFDTLALHAGAAPDPNTGARAVPIHQTTSYVYRDTAHAVAAFELSDLTTHAYTRLSNPTTAVAEERIAALEGGAAAVAVASGQAATALALLNLARTGDHIVASSSLYGGTRTLLEHTFADFGIEVTFVDDPDDLGAWASAVQELAGARVGPGRRERGVGRPGRHPRLTPQQPGDVHRTPRTDPQGVRQGQRCEAGPVQRQLRGCVPHVQRRRRHLHRPGDDGGRGHHL